MVKKTDKSSQTRAGTVKSDADERGQNSRDRGQHEPGKAFQVGGAGRVTFEHRPESAKACATRGLPASAKARREEGWPKEPQWGEKGLGDELRQVLGARFLWAHRPLSRGTPLQHPFLQAVWPWAPHPIGK